MKVQVNLNKDICKNKKVNNKWNYFCGFINTTFSTVIPFFAGMGFAVNPEYVYLIVVALIIFIRPRFHMVKGDVMEFTMRRFWRWLN